MLARQLRREVAVLRDQGADDRGMAVDGGIHPAGNLEETGRDVPRGGPQEPAQAAAVRRSVDDGVEFVVELLDSQENIARGRGGARGFADLRACLLDPGLDLLQFPDARWPDHGGGPLRKLAGDERVHQEHVLDFLPRYRTHLETTARQHFQQALVGQGDQGLPDRHRADLELLGQILDPQPVSGGVLAREQGVAQHPGDFRAEPGPAGEVV
jgi:hypothetical protein